MIKIELEKNKVIKLNTSSKVFVTTQTTHYLLEAIKEKELPDGVNIQKMKFWSCVVQYLTLLS